MPYLNDFKDDTNRIQGIQCHFSFMFSRHPFDRLFSVYRNKFMDPDPYGGVANYLGYRKKNRFLMIQKMFQKDHQQFA